MGDRTDWVMHEYRLCDDTSQGSPSFRVNLTTSCYIKNLGSIVVKNFEGLNFSLSSNLTFRELLLCAG